MGSMSAVEKNTKITTSVYHQNNEKWRHFKQPRTLQRHRIQSNWNSEADAVLSRQGNINEEPEQHLL
jgi:hypothetical protein